MQSGSYHTSEADPLQRNKLQFAHGHTLCSGSSSGQLEKKKLQLSVTQGFEAGECQVRARVLTGTKQRGLICTAVDKEHLGICLEEM